MTLDEHVAALQPQLISALREALRFRSTREDPLPGKPFGEGVDGALCHALRTAQDLGFRTVNVDALGGYAEYGQGDEMVAVLGHLDVVPEGTGWTRDPYGAEIVDGVLYGRGTLDDKGPTYAALFALAALRDAGIPLRRRLRVLFGTNEETGCACMEHYVKSGQELPVLGFTPDGSFPIINAEKGSVKLRLTSEEKAGGTVTLATLRGAAAVNIVPETAEAVLRGPQKDLAVLRRALVSLAADRSWPLETEETPAELTVRVRGKAAHASLPDHGINAAVRLLRLLGALPVEAPWRTAAAALGALMNEQSDGAALGIACCDTLSGPLTLNLGLLEVSPGGALVATLDIRYPVRQEWSALFPEAERRARELGLSVELLRHSPPLFVDPSSELIQALQRAYTAATGQDATLLAIGGGTYARTMPHVVAFGASFPGDPELMHQPDERISLERLALVTRILATAMVELAQ